MRNILSSFLAVIVGSYLIVILLGLSETLYPEPFNIIWFLLAGSSALQSTLMFILEPSVLSYIICWIVMGLIIGSFSKVGWNTVRSAVWVGLITAVLALASLLLLDPAFWDIAVNPARNIELLYQFAASMIVALFTMPSALLMALVVSRLSQQTEPPIPSKIETICDCGAVYKSKPMICSECGRQLIES